MAPQNALYRAPVNTSEGRQYVYVYHYEDSNDYIPDSSVFFIMVILSINYIAAMPMNVYYFTSIILDKRLHKCKFGFLALQAIADLLVASVANPISFHGILHGRMRKSECRAGAIVHTAALSLGNLTLGLLAFVTVLPIVMTDRTKHQQAKLIITRTSVGFTVVVFVILLIILEANFTPSLVLGWEPNLFTCSFAAESFTEVISGELDSHPFVRGYAVLYIFSMIVANLFLVTITAFLTYKVVRRFVDKNSEKHRRLSSERTQSNLRHDQMGRAAEDSFEVDSQVDQDIFLLLLIQCLIWEPDLIINLTGLDFPRFQAVNHHIALFTVSINPIVIIYHEPVLMARIERLYKKLKAWRQGKSIVPAAETNHVPGILTPNVVLSGDKTMTDRKPASSNTGETKTQNVALPPRHMMSSDEMKIYLETLTYKAKERQANLEAKIEKGSAFVDILRKNRQGASTPIVTSRHNSQGRSQTGDHKDKIRDLSSKYIEKAINE